MKLAGKRFIVTGAATGMGAATTAAFVREGAKVTGFYRSRGYEALAERLTGEAGSVHFLKVDVAEQDQVLPAFAQAVDWLGGLDGLIHAAAICPTTPAEDIRHEQLMDVDRCILEATDLFAAFRSEGQKLNVHLNVMSWHLLLIALGVQLAHSCASGRPVKAVALEDTVDAGVGDFDAVIARQIPNNPDWPEVILATQIQNLLNDLGRRLIGGVLRD